MVVRLCAGIYRPRRWPIWSHEWAITCWTAGWTKRSSSSTCDSPVFLTADARTVDGPCNEMEPHAYAGSLSSRPDPRTRSPPPRRAPRSTWVASSVGDGGRPSQARGETLTSFAGIDVGNAAWTRRRSRNVSIINLGLTFKLTVKVVHTV